jgi:hypothetical protein
VLPVPLITAAYFCLKISGVTASNAAKKFATKVCLSGIAAVLFVHIRAAWVALGSDRERFTKKHRKESRIKKE